MSENKEDQDSAVIGEPENLAKTLTHREKAVRDLFVKEYLVDYDELSATIRTGYHRSYAKEVAVKMMHDEYVLQQIQLMQAGTAEESPEVARKRVIQGLIREANYKGPGCSASARVAALAKLAAVYGMDAPTRNKTELTGPDGQPLAAGGFFVVPGISTVEEWEERAAAQQAQLVSGNKAAADAANAAESVPPAAGVVIE